MPRACTAVLVGWDVMKFIRWAPAGHLLGCLGRFEEKIGRGHSFRWLQGRHTHNAWGMYGNVHTEYISMEIRGGRSEWVPEVRKGFVTRPGCGGSEGSDYMGRGLQELIARSQR